MSQKTNAVAVRTIGIDTGKNTFHLIGRPIPPSLISGLQHAAELAQGPLKACLTGRRQRE